VTDQAVARVGYRLILPPGWTRIPVRDDPKPALDDILSRSFAGLPKDKYGPLQAELRKKLLAQIATARESQGIDLYLPIERVHGLTVAASFVVAIMEFDSVETPDAEDVLIAYAAQSDDATVAEIDSAPAVRTERIVAAAEGASPEDEASYGSRRVDYVIAIPDSADMWLSVSFSTLGDGDPDGDVAKLLVELFDAIMSTFRWQVES
jgi:hypothetical protein